MPARAVPPAAMQSPERPTSLVEGDRYDTSVAAAIVEAKWFHHLPIYRQQDVFAGSGWTPGRSTLLNIVSQVGFVISPFVAYHDSVVQQDMGVGIDETSCRMLLPRTFPRRFRRRQEPAAGGEGGRSARPRATQPAGQDVGLFGPALWRRTTSSTSASRGIATARTTSSATAAAKCREIASRATERGASQRRAFGVRGLLGACAPQGRGGDDLSGPRADLLLGMIQALYDVETRATELTWQDRQALRSASRRSSWKGSRSGSTRRR